MTERYLEQSEDQYADFSINEKSFYFHFFVFRGLVYMDVSTDDEPIVTGKRVLPNTWLLPSYIAEGVGNLRFETYRADKDDYVWYEGFNDKFRLVSYTDEEIKEIGE